MLDKEKSTPKSVTLSFLMNKIKRIQQDKHDRQDITYEDIVNMDSSKDDMLMRELIKKKLGFSLLGF